MKPPSPTRASPAGTLHALLDKLETAVFPAQAEIDTALGDFAAELAFLDGRHNRKNPWVDYLRQQVFARSRTFTNLSEYQAYCRCHLRVARIQFSTLLSALRDPQTGSISGQALRPWARTIHEYIFDLIEIANFLERKTPGYVFYSGGKSAGVHSWEVFLLSRGLASHSAYTGTGPHFDIKTSQIASIAVLRQARELRFERLIGVFPLDPKGKPPRLRHGFHLEFIENHPNHFRCSGFRIGDLKPIYDWCSEIVHQAYQPFAWQIAWAHELAGQLMLPRSSEPNAHWNIANAVEVFHPIAMQDAFFDHFLSSYEHGQWRLNRIKPEALTKQWPNPVPSPSSAFHAVRNPQSLWKDLIKLWKRWRPWHLDR